MSRPIPAPNTCAAMAATDTVCEPVFITTKQIPFMDAPRDTVDICAAAEKVIGRGTIRGAQRIRGRWRIDPKQRQFRERLLIEGFMLGGSRISVLDKNPFLISG